MKQCDTTTL